MKMFNENPADDILFSFSSNCHCLKPKSHFCLFLPCLSVLFVCFYHVLPNCFFFPFLFFSCLKKKKKNQVLYKHCVILPMLPSTDINPLSQQTCSQGEVLRYDREEQHCCSVCSHSEKLRAQGALCTLST